MPSDHHEIRYLTWPGIQPLDLVGPHEVFDAANRVADYLGKGGLRYTQRVLAVDAQTVTSPSGLQIATEPVTDDGTFDTLILPGGDGSREAAADPDVVAAATDLAARADRLATVCTGAFVAAATGILDGCRAATHWAWAPTLAEQYPTVEVDAEAMHIHDTLADGRACWSSAGVTAGMDLALAIVEHDHDAEVAQTVGQWLVVHLRRPGSQSQYAAPMWADLSPVPPVREAQEIIQAAPADDHGMETLARRVGVSTRHLTRLFQAETGETPGRYVERVRVDLARHELETGTVDLAAVARQVGFGSPETLRRAFHRRLGVSPDDYRRRFRRDPAPTTSH